MAMCITDPIVNRRMDEWVPVSRIDTRRGVVEETPKEIDTMLELNGRERKVTRNFKRKHDEINHIQKVCYFFSVDVGTNHIKLSMGLNC